jgi:hypothetical protein
METKDDQVCTHIKMFGHGMIHMDSRAKKDKIMINIK